jgi:hypothetical protein
LKAANLIASPACAVIKAADQSHAKPHKQQHREPDDLW